MATKNARNGRRSKFDKQRSQHAYPVVFGPLPSLEEADKLKLLWGEVCNPKKRELMSRYIFTLLQHRELSEYVCSREMQRNFPMLYGASKKFLSLNREAAKQRFAMNSNTNQIIEIKVVTDTLRAIESFAELQLQILKIRLSGAQRRWERMQDEDQHKAEAETFKNEARYRIGELAQILCQNLLGADKITAAAEVFNLAIKAFEEFDELCPEAAC